MEALRCQPRHLPRGVAVYGLYSRKEVRLVGAHRGKTAADRQVRDEVALQALREVVAKPGNHQPACGKVAALEYESDLLSRRILFAVRVRGESVGNRGKAPHVQVI